MLRRGALAMTVSNSAMVTVAGSRSELLASGHLNSRRPEMTSIPVSAHTAMRELHARRRVVLCDGRPFAAIQAREPWGRVFRGIISLVQLDGFAADTARGE